MSAPKPDRPNVLLVCVDHWPGTLLGCEGHSHVLTPTLDMLAGNGVRFSRAYSEVPVCIPARRNLMTGCAARTHGDRRFKAVPFPEGLRTMPQAFRDHGYQAGAVGKLHVHPQRNRIGFDEVILHEEGRHLDIARDDYEQFLADHGVAGQEFTHGMGSNLYTVRPWHLEERFHPTHWTTRQACRMIQRRDPTRPAFWYCSYTQPHPPIAPLGAYLEMYRDLGVDEPFAAEWSRDMQALPLALQVHSNDRPRINARDTRMARMGFYAQCTYIDHQLRLLVGTLREEGILANTILMFTCDHGDMLGTHGLWAKSLMYEGSARIPMILAPAAKDARTGHHREDRRLVELRDVMPTLLDLCGLPIPPSVEGLSMVGPRQRDCLYGECYENERASRMLRTPRHKLIWYPHGNRLQLFDLENDPREMRDLAGDPAHATLLAELEGKLAGQLYGQDLGWVRDGRLAGAPTRTYAPEPVHGLANQRGWR
jgi:arylsulfatase A-like enzyme